MSILVKNIIRFIFFILFQVFILNTVPPLHQFIVPYIYFLFILWLPFNINRLLLLIISFIFGLTLDYFTGSPGLHAAPCVLIAYLRHKSMGWAPYGLYVGVLSFIHHFYLVLIEWLQFGNFLYFIGKVGATTLISLMMILIAELLFARKGRLRPLN